MSMISLTDSDVMGVLVKLDMPRTDADIQHWFMAIDLSEAEDAADEKVTFDGQINAAHRSIEKQIKRIQREEEKEARARQKRALKGPFEMNESATRRRRVKP